MSQRSANDNREELITDVKSSLHHVEDLLREAAASTGDKAVELRDNAMVALKRLSETLVDMQDSLREHGKAAARATDDYVHENPWRSLGVAAAVGFLVGVLISRR
ncbi:DUF883 domain-containing protein [Verticiella sediminum]|uniref:DUF883 domain-containing protein n=1 Tax=Verticiella sediminum TaxID=1247510 RepID=A0A556AVT5_9BURK|nr:DUF883 family protein [Verticiella sediminum]TSH97020.1 DUF883 domain-containing protein [Verticiella sediminum]